MRSDNLIVVAKVLAKEENRDLVKEELFKLVKTTREEAGCISYDLHQDIENENLFLVFEKWENVELWKIHSENENLANFIKATDGCFEEFIINKMEKIG